MAFATPIVPFPVKFGQSPPSSSSSTPTESSFLEIQPTPRATSLSHYRPFSTLSQSPEPSPPSQSPPRRLRASRSSSYSISRPSSSASFPTMGFGFHDKDKDKEKTKEKGKDKDTRPRKVSDASPNPRPNSPGMSLFASNNGGESQRRFGSFTKRKKSFGSLLRPSSADGPSPSSSASQARRSIPFPTTPLSAPVSRSFEEKTELTPVVVIGHGDDTEEDEDYGTVKYQSKATWVKKYNMKLHPYPSDAPYMQAYEPILLENDRLTDILLHRLNPSPSFHDYGSNPPATVLDLGCGQGHWVLDAARAWGHSGTQVTGFDLVDVTLPAFEEYKEQVNFVRGNFLKYALPFSDNSFDLVRMANLTLCIPYDKWEFVLKEARRVLMVGGRLEVIDDALYWPYGMSPSNSVSPTTPRPGGSMMQPMAGAVSSVFDWEEGDMIDKFEEKGDTAGQEEGEKIEEAVISEFRGHKDEQGQRLKKEKNGRSRKNTLEVVTEEVMPELDTEDDKSDETDVDETDGSFDTASTLVNSSTDSHILKLKDSSISPSLSTPEDLTPKPPPVTPLTTDPDTLPSPDSDPAEWERQSDASRELEKLFEDLLTTKYGIYPRPSKFLLGLMRKIYGEPSANRIRTMQLKLAPRDSYTDGSDREVSDKASTRSGDSGAGKKAWMTIDSYKKEKSDKKEKKGDKRSRRDSDASTNEARSSSESVDSVGPLAPIPETISAKAAGRLGIAYTGLTKTVSNSSQVSSSSSSHSLSSSTQSPGLILWPATFLPMSPSELEMHACKNMHALLGCKPALAEYVEGFKDEDGKRIVEDDELFESMWQYECFRRRRFNWPSEVPDYDLEPQSPIDLAHTPTTATFRSSVDRTKSRSSADSSSSSDSGGPYALEELVHIRTIRVFEAIKTSDDELA